MLFPAAPLTRRQRVIYWSLVVFCAATRLVAVARSIWDWDEALFSLGMRKYDVALHHPHPPGFPLFIAMGRALRLVIPSDFRALQTVTVISAMLLFPAVYAFGRAIGLRFESAAIAGLLCAFFPNVWFFGGTAFSDLPSIVLVLFAVGFLMRGADDARAYFVGTLLLALAIGYRPQNLLVGLIPGMWATWHRWRRSRRDVILAALLGTVIVAAQYGTAMWLTGPERYLNAVRAHRQYIWDIDSFRNPDRPPLWRIFDRFFIKQYGAPALSVITSVVALIGIVSGIRQRSRPLLFALAAFGPFAILAWMVLDRFSISRFSIGYIPLFAVLAAEGIGAVALMVSRRFASERPWVEWGLAVALAGAFFLWTFPALAVARESISPPEEAVAAVARTIDPKSAQLYVAVSMGPFMEYSLPDFPWKRAYDEFTLPVGAGSRPTYLLLERDVSRVTGLSFTREHDRMWNIARRHYFDVSLERLDKLPQFGDGWYGPEHSDRDEWRWMGGHSTTLLPPTSSATRLRLHLTFPSEILPLHPHLIIVVNGVPIDRIAVAEESLEREYHIAARDRQWNTLELTIDRTTREGDPQGNGRELGAMLRMLVWGGE
jgi:hypothetical protein